MTTAMQPRLAEEPPTRSLENNAAQTLVRAIRDVGFPVVVACILLWHLLVEQPKQLLALTNAMQEAAAQLRAIDLTQVRILELLRVGGK